MIHCVGMSWAGHLWRWSRGTARPTRARELAASRGARQVSDLRCASFLKFYYRDLWSMACVIIFQDVSVWNVMLHSCTGPAISSEGCFWETGHVFGRWDSKIPGVGKTLKWSQLDQSDLERTSLLRTSLAAEQNQDWNAARHCLSFSNCCPLLAWWLSSRGSRGHDWKVP